MLQSHYRWSSTQYSPLPVSLLSVCVGERQGVCTCIWVWESQCLV